jgi:iron complex outermembrane receptor protein
MTDIYKPAGLVAASVRTALGLGLAGLAMSQAQAATPNDDLVEVVVTAQFREQNLQDTPLAITAMSAALLESRNQTNISEITNQAPNVTLKQQGAQFGPSMAASIRGVGQTDFNPAVEPGVGIYVDDVYYATLTGSVLDLLDLERVEILRGPQGTLAGKNSIGGAVKLFSKLPKGDDTGSLQVTYGSRNRIDLRASGDFALTDTLFARISGVSKKQEGYMDRVDYGCANPGNPYGIASTRATSAGCVVARDSNVDFSAARLSLRWLPTDNLEFNLSGDYTADHRNPTGMILLQGRPASFYTNTAAGNRPVLLENVQPTTDASLTNNAPWSAFQAPVGSYFSYATFASPAASYTGTTAVGGAYATQFNGTTLTNYAMAASTAKPGMFFDGGGSSLVVDWKLSDTLKLKSVTAYREYSSGFTNDNDQSPLGAQLGDGSLPFHSFSEELRLNGGLFDSKVDYTLGAFYMNQSARYQSWQDLRYTNNYPLQFQQNDVTNSDSKAVFGHLGYAVTEKLSLTTGIRYTEEHKDYTFVRLARDGTVHPFLGALNGVHSNYDGSNVDYRFAAQYRWNDELMTYAQYSTGFKGGGISPRPFVPGQARPFNPETLSSVEVGAKVDLFDRKLRVNTALFHSKYKDLQLGLSSCPQYNNGIGGPCGVIANAGDATIQGAEAEIVYRPVAGLSVDASYSYIDFKYDRLPAGSPYKTNYDAPFMPKQKWSAGLQYDLSLGDAGTLTPRVDVSYQGGLYTNGNNQPTNYIDGYTLANARVTWKEASGKWESSLEVTNLTDKWYLLSKGDAYANAGSVDAQPARPREWALTVKRKF